MYKIGEKIIVTFLNSCLTIGGTVLMVVVAAGKPAQYCVETGGMHTFFDETQLTIKQINN